MLLFVFVQMKNYISHLFVATIQLCLLRRKQTKKNKLKKRKHEAWGEKKNHLASSSQLLRCKFSVHYE